MLFTLAAPSGLRGRLAVGGAEFDRVGFAGVEAGDVVVWGFESMELLRRGCGVDSAESDCVERTLELRLSFMGEAFGGRKENRFPFYRTCE
ncbi:MULTISPECIES: hypothetical protein [unclassified Corallococcus]|uniref:hypothetical protein n=1 Tax=unclassified Corallococcus TaxID=2685029 RepID=UPI001CBC9137|nr:MULTISPECIES: hypothetical protein [unclassified Corallococcus]MBZ4335602.1 hypothetical protein [Corallococcus sp. AS-1-12]MBZ4370908.1 hypothetical protein [Corallococcus sp. AS-1-6]